MTSEKQLDSHRPTAWWATTLVSWVALPPVVRTLVLARAVNRMGAFSLPFLAVLLVQSGQFSMTEAGLLLGLFGAATLPSRLLGGALHDRIGPVPTIVLGLIGCALFQAGIAANLGSTATVIAIVGLGLAFELYEPPSQALIADLTPQEQHSQAYGFLGTALAVGAVAAGLLAAVVGRSDLYVLFWIDALTCLTCAGVVIWRVQAPRRPTGPFTCVTEERGSPWRDPRLLALLTANTLFASIYLQVPAALSFSLVQVGSLASQAGLLLALSAATIALGQPILQRGPAALRHPTTGMVWGYAVLGVGFFASGLARNASELALATVVASAGDLLLLGHAYTLVARIAPLEARGRYFAAYGMSWGMAAVLSGPLLTGLVGASGTVTYWFVGAAVALVLTGVQARVGTWIWQPDRVDPE